MACNCCCNNNCNVSISTTNVAYNSTTNVITLTIPTGVFTNKEIVCLKISQNVPTWTGVPPTVVVQSGTTSFNVRTPCGNNLYADQLIETCCNVVRTGQCMKLKFASDTSRFIMLNVTKCSGYPYPTITTSSAT